MKAVVAAVGRLKQGPERDIVDRYAERASALARDHGIAFVVAEVVEGRGRRGDERRVEEATALLQRVGPAEIVVFDERASSLSSRDFAARLSGWRDAGRDVAFVIGGPDGLDPNLRGRAALSLSFGRLTLPHQLVRMLVVEQIYRALTILAGHPYHRDGSP